MSTLKNLINAVEQKADDVFLADVIEGLTKPQKTLPCKYFYDEPGSRLFEQICETPEYYVTRTECHIYQRFGAEMAANIGERALIIEPGAGSVKKIALLLEHLRKPTGFIPMDISPEILQSSSETLAELFPDVAITPVVTDFLDAGALKAFFNGLSSLSIADKRVVFFPGSTIGNFHPEAARDFLQHFSANLDSGDGLLIGVDLVKDHRRLEAAYDDQSQVTANFNLNLLHRINNELNGEINVEDFSHRAVFNLEESRIEMHLVSNTRQSVYVAGHEFEFEQDETIHTENSYKYKVDDFQQLALQSGFEARALWTDSENLFSVHYLQVI